MKIICFYTNNKQKHGPFFPASQNKLDYVISSLQSIGEQIEIISLSNVSISALSMPDETVTDNGVKIYYPKSYARKSVFQKIVYKLKYKKTINRYLDRLLSRCSKGEVIYVYHMSIFHKVLKKLIKKYELRMILEVEEIYGDVTNNLRLKEKELEFFKIANGFVFSTNLLNENVNKDKKPYVVANGSYSIKDSLSDKFNDGKIHVVYSGTFRNQKGCSNAIQSALFLTNDYHMHILGYGSEIEQDKIKQQILEVEQQTDCVITFDGLKVGVDFDSFLQRCDIGLCPQSSNSDYNNSSFPSKILTYATNNLRIVSIRIKAIEDCAVADFITFFDSDDPEALAEAIKKVDLSSKNDMKERMKELDNRFKLDLEKLIKDVR